MRDRLENLLLFLSYGMPVDLPTVIMIMILLIPFLFGVNDGTVSW